MVSLLDVNDREVLHVALESRAAWFAAGAHGSQMYGDACRYRQHLVEVRDLMRVVFDRARLSLPLDLRQAVWLHDVLEDTDITDAHLLELFAPEVVHLVQTVTARGGNRKSRVAVKGKKLRESMQISARILAIVDRIANVRCALQGRRPNEDTRLLKMYVQEAEDFELAVSLNVAHGFVDAHLAPVHAEASQLLAALLHGALTRIARV